MNSSSPSKKHSKWKFIVIKDDNKLALEKIELDSNESLVEPPKRKKKRPIKLMNMLRMWSFQSTINIQNPPQNISTPNLTLNEQVIVSIKDRNNEIDACAKAEQSYTDSDIDFSQNDMFSEIYDFF